MKNMTLVLFGVFLMLSGCLLATPLNREHIPAEAKWVVHLDVERFTESRMWGLLRQEISEETQEEIDECTNSLGSDPTKDIYGITLYGTDSEEENAVVMIYGKFDKEKLLGLIVQNEAYAESEYNDRKLYHWVDEEDGKERVGMFGTEGHIVISQNEETVKAMIDLLDGDGDSLADREDAPLAELVKTPEDAFIVMAAYGLAELNKDNQENAILQNSKMMAVVAGENTGDMYLHINLTAETKDGAKQIEKMLDGIEASVALKLAEKPEIMSLLEAINLECSGNQLFLRVKYPSAKLFEIIKEVIESKKKIAVEGREYPGHIDILSAAAEGNLEAIKQHVSAGTDINTREPYGRSTPLIVAAAFGQTEAAALLIENGADVNAVNNEGATPLHAAAFFGRTDTVKLLLAKGADVNAENNKGQTPLDTVAGQWNQELEGIYEWFEEVVEIELDIERIKAVRPEIAEILRKKMEKRK